MENYSHFNIIVLCITLIVMVISNIGINSELFLSDDWLEKEKTFLNKFNKNLNDSHFLAIFFSGHKIYEILFGQYLSFKWFRRHFLFSFIVSFTIFLLEFKSNNHFALNSFLQYLLSLKFSFFLLIYFLLFYSINHLFYRTWYYPTHIKILKHIPILLLNLVLSGIVFSLGYVLSSNESLKIVDILIVSFKTYFTFLFSLNCDDSLKLKFMLAISLLFPSIFYIIHIILASPTYLSLRILENVSENAIKRQKSIVTFIALIIIVVMIIFNSVRGFL